MKLAIEQQETHSRGIQTSHEYQVLNNSKIMNMLSSQLYSNKILSPIRELVSNSYDSHVMAKQTNEKIVITLPSKDNPEFRIRDYGTGLSEDQLINLYRFYGLSDKDGDNTQIGCLGLGSKSAWAYSSVYTTTSYYNGEKYIYVNNKSGKNGIPELRKLHEESTDEPNGVEISFAVNICDIQKFAQYTAEVLYHFPLVFKVIDDTNLYDKIFQSLEREPLFQGNRWRIFDGMDKPVAIMGYIAYPIKKSILNHILLGCNIEIDFEIGDLGVNIGREELEYTPQTTKAITEKLEKIHNEVMDVVRKDIDKCECYFDACVKYKKSPYYLQKLLGQIKYHDRQLDTYLYLGKYYCQSFYKQYGKTKKRITSSLSYTENLKFVINDIVSGSNTLLNEMINADGIQILSIKVDEKDNANKDIQIKDICNIIGIPESRLIYLSAVKSAKPKVKRTYSGIKREISTLLYKDGKGYGKSSYWTNTSIKLEDGGYYITATGFDFVIDDKKVEPSGLKRLLSIIGEFGDSVPSLIGLRPTHVKKAKKNPKWIYIADWIQEKVDGYNKLYTIDDIIIYNTRSKISYWIPILERLSKNPNFKCEDLKVLVNKSKKNIENYRSLQTYLSNYNIFDIQGVVASDKVLDVIEKYDVIFDVMRNYGGIDKKYDESLIKLFNSLQ